MVPAIGTTLMGTIFKELKKDEDESQKTNRLQANSYFDQQISTNKAETAKMKEQAKSVGKFGMINFVINIVTAILSAVGGAFGSALSTGLKFALEAGKGILGSLQKFLQSVEQKKDTESKAKAKELAIEADTFAKISNDFKSEQQEDKKRSAEALQAARDAQRDMISAQEAMIKV